MTRTTSLYETCQNLFEQYPLAVDNVNQSGTIQSMVLMVEDNGEAAFFLLGHYAKNDHYGLNAWRAGQIAEIGPASEPPAAGEVADILACAVPLPRDESSFGWQAGGTVTALINFYVQYTPESPEPMWSTMPMEGLPGSAWPPFTADHLFGPGFWDYLRDGDIVNVAPVIAATPGAVFWAQPDSLSSGCCAVARDVMSPDGWTLPQGRYVYWQSLRDGETAGPLDEVLAGDVTDVSPRFRTRR